MNMLSQAHWWHEIFLRRMCLFPVFQIDYSQMIEHVTNAVIIKMSDLTS
jgi:hypothetical protein